MSWVSRSPTGRSRSPSWTLPSGRPRWLARMTAAPPWSRAEIVGMAARIRESSVTLQSASGTLKSTRTKTRFPATSTSRMVSLSIGGSGGDGQTGGDEGDQVGDPAAIAPFVVVPGDHLDHRAAEDHRRLGVDDRAPAVALEVHRHERLVRHAKDAFERPGGRGPEGVVELLDRGRPADVGREVDDADRRSRHAQAEPVELALEVGDDERESLRRAGRRWDDVLPGAAGAARILVRDVEDALVVGVAVDRVHQAALDRQQVMDDLCGGGQAVRRAAGVADDVVDGRVIAILVDPEYDRDVLTLGRSADDDLARPRIDVRLGLGGIGEQAGALEHDVDPEVAPRQARRITLGKDPDLAAVDHDRRVAGPNVARVGAIGRVALEQEGVHLGINEVVDGDDLGVRRALDQRLERLPTDPAEAVDANASGHKRDLLGEMHAGTCRTRGLGRSGRTWDRTGVPRTCAAGPPDRASPSSYQRVPRWPRARRPDAAGHSARGHGRAPAVGGGPGSF